MIVEMTILTILMITQIILFIIFFHYGKNIPLIYTGYLCWVLSAIFGWLPIYEFRKKGKVPQGKSYVHTTAFVDSGVYSIVRHPQFLAGVLLSLAFIFIAQHWSVFATGLPAIAILYKDMFRADQSGIKKFGSDYQDYIKRVPRMNFLIGLIRLTTHQNAMNERNEKD